MQRTRVRSSTILSTNSGPSLPGTVLNKPPVKTENVQVTVRVRPPNAQERGGAGLLDTWNIDAQGNRISLSPEFIERTRKPPAEFYYGKQNDP
ncbi:hypothetical protein IWQ61_009934, partial [Dispira simplex]